MSENNTSIKDQDLTNRYVLINTQVLAPRYQSLNYRLFLCEGGFGCKPFLKGTAILGVHPFDGEEVRWERYQVERFATQEEIDLVLSGKEKTEE